MQGSHFLFPACIFLSDFLFSVKTTTLLMDYSFFLRLTVFQGLLDDFLLPEGPQMTQESVANNTIYSADAAILKASKQDNKASSL